MKRPLTRPLIKIFANGFYQENTGLLLTLFVFVFINFFYTNVLNQTHLTHDQLIQNALKLVISSVKEPLGMALLLGLFYIYSLKSWYYVAKRLDNVDVQFLFYSANAASWEIQMKSWLAVQFIISMPILVVGLYAVVVGGSFGYWLSPFLIILYLIGLNVYGAYRYTTIVNNVLVKTFKIINMSWLRKFYKPLFSLFIYEIAVRKRLPYFVTKLASLAGIMLLSSVFNESITDVRLFGVVAICVALAHAILLYQANSFELHYMQFTRNFPYSQGKIYGYQWILWALIMLPELLWFLVVGGLANGLVGAVLAMTLVLLFRSVLKCIGQHMYYYLRIIFGLSITFLVMNLFGLTLLVTFFNSIAAWALLYRFRNRLVMEEA